MKCILVLRKCRKCGKEAYTEEDLKHFHKKKISPYGCENLCNACVNTMMKGKYLATVKRLRKKHHDMRQKFLGKLLDLKENPRTNICSKCGRRYPEELKTQTCLHHLAYDPANPVSNTVELCPSCHVKLHWTMPDCRYGRKKRLVEK